MRKIVIEVNKQLVDGQLLIYRKDKDIIESVDVHELLPELKKLADIPVLEGRVKELEGSVKELRGED